MKNGKIIALVAAAALAAALGLVGCGPQSASSAPASASSPAASSASASAASKSASAASPAASSAAASPSAASASAAAASTAAPAASAAAPANQASYIGEDAAKAAALAHAGFAEGDVIALVAELDADDGTPHYDVDFKSGGMEYDYDIDAATGNVLIYSSEVDN